MRASVRRLVAWTIAFAGAFFANCPADIGASAWAQAPSDNLWTRPTLSGDWGGLRSTLERNGVTFTFNYNNDFLANVRGGIGRGAIGLGAFQRRSTSIWASLPDGTAATFTPTRSSPTARFSVRPTSATS